MTPEVAQFSNKGMNQDISVSKATNEFAFENYNIRITAVNDNTLLSVTNEKNPIELNVQIEDFLFLNEIKLVRYSGGALVMSEFRSEKPVASTIRIEYTDANGQQHNITIPKGSSKSNSISKTLIKSYKVSNPISDNIYHYYTEYEKSEPNYPIIDTIKGIYLGHSILNNKLILFTKDISSEDTPDMIYVLEIQDNTLKGRIKYKGNLNFSLEYPIETLPYYESELVQKVYWVDGYNQPRVINIASDNIVERLDTQFDFNPTITKFPEVTITKEYSGVGSFPAGVIQYFISYYNKYGAETGIVYQSPLNYISLFEKSMSPDETSTVSFNIELSNLDTSFEYVRIYSMIRTSVDATPICSIVGDYKTSSYSVKAMDTNLHNTSIDDTMLLFLGGNTIKPSTITQKDDVLFVGDIIDDSTVIGTDLKDILKKIGPSLIKFGTKTISPKNQIDKDEASFKTFKYGEKYRFALQFQNSYSGWTEPIWIGDKICDVRPSHEGDIIKVASANIQFSTTNTDDKSALDLIKSRYVNYRLLIAKVNYSDRRILAQGILNPTVFNYKNRADDFGPYTQASWILRPENTNDIANSHLIGLGNYKTDKNDFINLPTAEIQNSINKLPLIKGFSEEDTEKKGWVVSFLVDTQKATQGTSVSIIPVKLSEGNTGESIYKENIDIRFARENDEYFSINSASANYSGYRIETFLKEFFKVDSLDIFNIAEDDIKNYLNKTLFKSSKKHYDDQDPIEELNGWRASYFYIYSNRGSTGVGTISNTDYTAGAYIFIPETYKLVVDTKEFENNFYVDTNIVTFHSPETTNIQNIVKDNKFKCSIVGIVPINNYRIDIDVSTNTAGYYSKNVNKKETLLNPNLPLFKDQMWDDGGKIDTTKVNYYMYLWQKDGSIIGQTSDSKDGTGNPLTKVYADLKRKIFGYFKKSDFTEYWNPNNTTNLPNLTYNISPTVFSSDNIETALIKIDGKDKYYQGNIDLINTAPESGYVVFYEKSDGSYDYSKALTDYSPVSIKYKTNPHLVFALQQDLDDKTYNQLLPTYSYYDDDNSFKYQDILYDFYEDLIDEYTTDLDISTSKIPWSNTCLSDYYKQKNLADAQENFQFPITNAPYLFLAEIIKDIDDDFWLGGTSDAALKSLTWIPASKAVAVTKNINNTFGDSYYQRWDLIHSFPFTEDDQNSVVDTLSFMVESYINLEGDYSAVNPEKNTLNVRKENTNKINPIYSQINNYFTYNILDEKFNQTRYRNQIAFSLQKTPTSEIDTWCNITLASAFNLNGNYGKVNKLVTVNDSIIAFQDKALSVINFNNRTALTTEAGIPIEIANSGKVDGYSIISSNLGCQNKYSICQTPSGVYFIDDLNKTMYVFNKEGLSNISSKGMSMWFKKNLTGKEKVFYDSLTNDIYITNENTCLVFNETLDSFTSFMDYKNIYSLFNFEGCSILLDNNSDVIKSKLMFGGNYTNDYYIQYKINPEPLIDKTFTNIEFIADKLEGGDIDSKTSKKNLLYPFTEFEVWNEYQYGINNLTKGRTYPNFERKFRIWRADIPRDESNGRDRIRNPWIYLKLNNTDNNNAKMAFHSFLVKYYK